MESLKIPQTGSGACTPTRKTPIDIGNSSSKNISVIVRYDADNDVLGRIYPLCQNTTADDACTGPNTSSVSSSKSNCEITLMAASDAKALQTSPQAYADEPSIRSSLLQGNMPERNSGLCLPTQQQQLSPNPSCTNDASESGSRSPSSPIGAIGFTPNGSIPRATVCSAGISPSPSGNFDDLVSKYNQNFMDYIGGGGTSCSSNDSVSQENAPAESVGLLHMSGFVRNGLDMRHLNHCLGDLMRNMGAGDGAIEAVGCNSTDCMRGNGKVVENRLKSTIISASNVIEVAKIRPTSQSSPQGTSGEATEIGACTAGEQAARYSRKVFVGGLPPDIDEDEITASFRRFGPLVVDWPHKAESKSYFPPKGYAFLLFQDETSVQSLIDACILDDDKLYLCVSSPTIKDKPVQIRPWRLNDADYVLDATMSLDPRKTVFVGGVPRPLKAFELAMIMDRLYGGVCYAGIDTDPELKYPKGAGRVAFSNQQSYISAISARFVQLQHADIDKRVEVKPYVLDDQMCDECEGQRCGGKFAPFFCANVTCLQYYCEHCWAVIHSRPGREYHKPLVKEGADRPRAVPFRWC